MRGNKGRLFLFLSVLITIVLYVMPFGQIISRPIVWLSTLAHEMGHGIAAVIVGGKFHQFVMYADASGVATTSFDGRIDSAIVSAGGLIGPAVLGAVCFLFATRARGLFLLLGLSLVVADVMVVRNLFGLVFVGICASTFLFLAVKGSTFVQQVAAYFLGIQMSLSVFSRGDYLFTEYANTSQGKMPSDVAHMAQALFLPYWFWGAFCGMISILVLLGGIRAAWKQLEETSESAA